MKKRALLRKSATARKNRTAMLKPKVLPAEVVNLLLPLLKSEFTAGYMYRGISNWAKGVGFKKAAEYFHKESANELGHAKLIEDFLVDWNVTPTLPQLEKPKTEFSSLAEVIETAYKAEFKLYEDYEDVSAKIFATGDICAFDFLQPLRKIQTESVAEYSDMLNMLEGCNPSDKFQMLLLEEKLFNA